MKTAVENVIQIAEQMGIRPRPLASQSVFRAPHPSVRQAAERVLAMLEADYGMGRGAYCECCNEVAPTIDDVVVGPVPHTPDCEWHNLKLALEREA